MQIPNREQAIIAPEKLRGYLLSGRHPTGRFKAAFFRRLGYTEENWRDLDRDLRTQHLEKDAEEDIETVYGRKFIVEAALEGPAGERASLVSVWVVRAGEDVPRFVTAYPGRQ
jgi:hypothetical protein